LLRRRNHCKRPELLSDLGSILNISTAGYHPYLEERGIPDELVQKFGIGFFPGERFDERTGRDSYSGRCGRFDRLSPFFKLDNFGDTLLNPNGFFFQLLGIHALFGEACIDLVCARLLL
jgi:hypothetical protein